MITVMAGVRGRRKNPHGGEHEIRARVGRDQHQKTVVMADALGISVSALLDRMIQREVLDEHGRPTWWPHVQDELPGAPLKSA